MHGLFYATNLKKLKVTEQDNIRDLFSKGLADHTTPVRPEVWQGLQSKMAAAGLASGSAAAAAKGISALTKWIIGGAAVTAVAVTTVVLSGNTEKQTAKDSEQQVAFSSPARDGRAENEQAVAPGEAQPQTRNVEPGSAVMNENRAPGIHTPAGSEERTGTERLPAPPPPPSLVKEPEIRPREIFSAPTVSASKPEATKTENRSVESRRETQPATNSAGSEGAASKPVASRSKIGEVPNVFTSGANNRFSIKSELLEDFSITILNNRGVPVFKSTDPDFVWDGKMLNGEDAPAGTYSCIIIARGERGELLKEYKPLEIIR